ncbi:MAG TPA: helix-turn-helix domain-containing protein [Candidatus Krumholzibacterium sp.]|nr:helix-turn-helix domain-containing protein [Candidatus Krumholzibacterium sp.]
MVFAGVVSKHREVVMVKQHQHDYGSIIIGGHDDTSEVMTSVEAADYLKMHVKTVCRLAKEKKIPAKKVGSEWRFLRSVLDRWLSQEEVYVHAD